MSRWEFGLRAVGFSLIVPMALVFAIDQWGEELTLFLLAFNALPAAFAMWSWPWPSFLRFLRLVSAAAAASAGALLTLNLGVLLDPDASWTSAEMETSSGTTAALIIAVAVGVAGTWAADLTVAHRADAESEARHRELLDRIDGALSAADPSPRERLRPRDLLLLAIAARLLRP